MKGRFSPVLIAALFVSHPLFADISTLWGNAGESWSPTGRLPDFSFAGYRSGQKNIPNTASLTNVRDNGAKGDASTDDSGAFQTALSNTDNGAVLIPAGRYLLTKQLRITQRGAVLRGEGPDKTVLFFPNSLTQAVGPGATAAPGGAWSWSGGFISFEGKNNGVGIAKIIANAQRGSDRLKVLSTRGLIVGQRVRVRQIDAAGELTRLLHADQIAGSEQLTGKTLVDFSCVIMAIDGATVRLNRPLRVDVRTAWKPLLLADQPSVEEVGIENLSIVFPAARYAGHHVEPGFNAISFENISNGWVRNVRIINCDAGIILRSGTKFCTIQNVTLTAERGRALKDRIGHHGILVAGLSQDNLIDNFHMEGKFIHDLCVTGMAAGNVFMNGKAEDLTLDHHRKAPYENLFTNIDAGIGSQLWLNGGDLDAGPPSGARETLWNVRAANALTLPPWALQFNFVGVTTRLSREISDTHNWIEPIAPEKLTPPNLFAAQQKHRTQ